MTISKDRVKPSPQPDSWKLREIFATGVVLGSYLALMTVVFFWAMKDTHFFPVNNLYLLFSCFPHCHYQLVKDPSLKSATFTVAEQIWRAASEK